MAKNLLIVVCVLYHFGITCFAQPGNTVRAKVQHTYYSQVGIREKTGHNDGVEVERYLSYVWLKKGNPWCAAFVSWTFGQNGIKKARSGGCVQLMEQGRTIYKSGKQTLEPQQADVFFIWFSNLKRVAHTGFVDKWSDTWVTTVEGNTNEAGSREGDGVYKKKRLRRQIYAVCSYIN